MRYFANEFLAVALLAAAGTVLAQGLPPEKPAAPPAKEQSLEKMTLEEMLALALKNNPDLRVAEAKLREAEAELNRTRLGVVQKIIAFRAGLDAARKTVADAEARLKRLQQLRANHAVAAEVVDEATAALAVAKFELAKLEAEAPLLLGKAQGLDLLRRLDFGSLFDVDGSRESRVQPGGTDLSPPGTRPAPLPASVAAKLREGLEASVRIPAGDASLYDLLENLERQVDGLNFRNALRTLKDPNPTLTLKARERVPVRAVLQMIEDEISEPGVRFVVREYGILVVPADAVPPGSLLVQDFLRGDTRDAADTAAVRKNPPKENVEGMVKQVDAATGLVTISIGSDAGLQKGHTLEVFRLNPAKYLGTLTVVEVQPTTAVGRVKGVKDAVQAGDRVASRLIGN